MHILNFMIDIRPPSLSIPVHREVTLPGRPGTPAFMVMIVLETRHIFQNKEITGRGAKKEHTLQVAIKYYQLQLAA